MSDTSRYAMPLLDAAQAQKHVTVNEALLRADALGARVAEDKGLTVPPVGPADGTAWIVGAAATGDWAGQDDAIALFLNGGWLFVTTGLPTICMRLRGSSMPSAMRRASS